MDATAGGRFAFSTPFQQYALEAAYLMERSPKEDKMVALAEQANIKIEVVRRWFGWRNGELDLAQLDRLREKPSAHVVAAEPVAGICHICHVESAPIPVPYARLPCAVTRCLKRQMHMEIRTLPLNSLRNA